MSSWSCPYEFNGACRRVNHIACDPGMKGCILFGRFRWADESKNRPPKAAKDPKPPAPDGEEDAG